jgi:hypothetical protein
MRYTFTWRWLLLVLLIGALGLAACGDDDDGGEGETAATEAVTEEAGTGSGLGSGGLDISGGPSLDIQPVGDGLPGCNDPNDTECPMPLELEFDGEVSAEGVALAYPTRYLNAAAGDDAPEGVLIQITPNERYAFEEQATFDVYYADSVDAALADLADPLLTDWDPEALPQGVVGVVKDQEQDPPVNTAIGVFPVPDDPDGRAIVLRLVTTGKYGWDLFSLAYEQMLDSLTVPAGAQ